MLMQDYNLTNCHKLENYWRCATWTVRDAARRPGLTGATAKFRFSGWLVEPIWNTVCRFADCRPSTRLPYVYLTEAE